MNYWDDIERARCPHEGPYTYVQTTPLPRITTMSKIDPKQCVMCGGVGEHSADCPTPAWRYPEPQTPRNLQLAIAEASLVLSVPIEEQVARLLAHLHYDRREWRGACTKAERTAWLVDKYWPQFRSDAARVIEQFCNA